MASITIPDIVPSPEQDAERLRKAFQGFGTDEKAIILVLGHRSASQRQRIRETYERLYNESLIYRLTSELSGDFRDAVILWTYDPAERDAELANKALKKTRSGVKHLQVIVEMACASSPHHLAAVRKTYCALFERSLEEDIADVVPWPLRKLLVSLVSSYRYDKELVAKDVVSAEATYLYEAIKANKLDHDHILYVLATRNFCQLRATFQSYKEQYGNPIDQDIMKYGKGDFVSLVEMVILCIDSPERHFAEVVRTSILGLGTDEASLNRAIISRAEIDLKKIKEIYPIMYKANLDDDVIDDTSGDYKNFLLTLTGANSDSTC